MPQDAPAAPRPGLAIADLERRATLSLERSARRRATELEERWTPGDVAAAALFVAVAAGVVAAWLGGA